MKPLIIQTEAKLELAEAIAWYNGQRPGLGLDLLAGVERAFDRLARERAERFAARLKWVYAW